MSITPWQMVQRQSLPLALKIAMSERRIRDWYEHWRGQVYVAFSGGKDSTVLLHLVRSMYPKVSAVFVDTGLEYPEVRAFVKTKENVHWLLPRMAFPAVIARFGYPVVSKDVAQKIYDLRTTSSSSLIHRRLYGDAKGNGRLPSKWLFLAQAPFPISSKCCDVMKKDPSKAFERGTGLRPFIGTMADDSRLRRALYLKQGCNAFTAKRAISAPLAFWLEQDIWDYIEKYAIEISSIYKMGYKNTGCMYCMFGVHLASGLNKFQIMKSTHPKQYRYCIEKLGCGKILDYINVHYV